MQYISIASKREIIKAFARNVQKRCMQLVSLKLEKQFI